MNWDKLPQELKIVDFRDFFYRCEDIYDLFWEDFAPFFDISLYRDYLVNEVKFSIYEGRQIKRAGLAWEFLMGDKTKDDLFDYWAHNARKN